MQLLADRFVIDAVWQDKTQIALDLATGNRVILTLASAGGASEQGRWGLRCHTLQNLHHPVLAPLLDYGAVGEVQRFEAWRCEAVPSGTWAAAESARLVAADVLT